MSHDWIIDVLADLRVFARANGLHDLAEHLDDAAMVATRELAVIGAVSSHGTPSGELPGRVGARGNA